MRTARMAASVVAAFVALGGRGSSEKEAAAHGAYAADMGTDTKTLIAELQTNVVAETVITGSYEPLRQ